MNARHTPGPWTYEPEEENGEPAEKPRFFTIHGPLYFADVHMLTIHEDHGIAEANASLIAAAPDMLAALEAYDAAMSACWGGIDGLPSGNPDAARCWSMARAAIAKARGE